VRLWLVGALLGCSVAALAYSRRALTFDGAVAAACVGAVTWARGGAPAVAALLTFFGTSSVLSRVGERRKRALPLAQAKGAQRDAWQVIANGGIATLCIATGQRSAFLGALAAAAADTWATELGMLASTQPRLITSFKAVPAGTSGGITPQGLAASAGGALVVGVVWACIGGGWRAPIVAVLAGVGGSLADSLLGATMQAVYWCPSCEVSTEATVHMTCSQATLHTRGFTWMTNDTVNALATLLGAIIGGCSRAPDAAGHVRGGS